MRITMRAATAGVAAHASLPHLPEGSGCFVTDKQVLDEIRARQFFAGKEWCDISGTDDADTVAVGVEFIDRLQRSFKSHADKHQGEIIPTPDGKHQKDLAERRMDRGKCAIVRIDIRRIVGGFRFCVDWANPNNAVGDTENLADTFARTFAAVAITLAADWNEVEPKLRFEFVDGKNCPGLFADERMILAAMELLEKHERCERRVNGYCSPCNTDCPYYANGRCEWR